MIHAVPNPKMTLDEIKAFRKNFARCVSKDISPEQMSEVKRRRARIKVVYARIMHNNGGKNPILGN